MTEGVAKLSDVVSFLWDGGTRGLLNCMKQFERAMFGGMARFRIPRRSALYLCLTLLVLAALTVINGVIITATAAKAKDKILQPVLEQAKQPPVSAPAIEGGQPATTAKAEEQRKPPPASPLATHWDQMAAIASCMVAVAFTFGVVLLLADTGKPQNLNAAIRRLLSGVGWISFAITIIEIIGTAFLLLAMTHLDWITAGAHCENAPEKFAALPSVLARPIVWVICFFQQLPAAQLQTFATAVILATAVLLAVALTGLAMLRSSEKRIRDYPVTLVVFTLLGFALNVIAMVVSLTWEFKGAPDLALPAYLRWMQSSIWVWPFLALFSAQVRTLLVQYVGDVAIYVCPNKLDRFNKVRTEIKECAHKTLSAIFTAHEGPNGTGFLYKEVAVVGHSLGSVIAYDTLNRLMLEDWLSGHTMRVPERAKTLVTFGSPLNKTAFFFTIQAKDSMHIRERLASTVQPLIISYRKFRENLKWINVYSGNDIICGRLEFYDLPGFVDPGKEYKDAVKNVADLDAFVPIIAHVSYWNNPTVWRELLEQVAPVG